MPSTASKLDCRELTLGMIFILEVILLWIVFHVLFLLRKCQEFKNIWWRLVIVQKCLACFQIFHWCVFCCALFALHSFRLPRSSITYFEHEKHPSLFFAFMFTADFIQPWRERRKSRLHSCHRPPFSRLHLQLITTTELVQTMMKRKMKLFRTNVAKGQVPAA